MNRSPGIKKLEWRHFVVLVLAAFPWVSMAQMTVHGDDEDYTYESREGIEFGINIGAYRGDQLSPYFYDGSGDRTLAEGSGNAQIWSIQERLQQLQSQQLTHPVTGILNEYPGWQLESLPLMQYRTSMMFGLKMAKYWNPETALVCQLDAVQMTAEGAWNLSTGLLPDQGQGNADIRTYPILGKEQRMLVSLGYRTAIYLAEDASWTVEFGGMANATSVEENYIVVTPDVGNAIYEVNLLTSVGNGNGQLTPANKLLTQWGTGFYASGGIDLA
ncbi:MAG: hypothetical protein L7S02_03890, partial [Flavobacteriales bacterium]|nr:hypothetical protein [Flavobacteriales bacterium]